MENLINEFVMARCEDFLSNDVGYNEINKELSIAETNLKSILTEDQIKLFLVYESLFSKIKAYTEVEMYKLGNQDKF